MTTLLKTDKGCTEDLCDGKHVARGYCSKHYQSRKNAGEFSNLRPKRKHNLDDDAMRVHIKGNVRVEDTGYTTDCWTWTGSMRDDYGQIGYDYHSTGNLSPIGVHRLSYKLFKGELIKGLVIDHLCHHKPCCNPEHLRQVTQQINVNNRYGSDSYTGGKR